MIIDTKIFGFVGFDVKKNKKNHGEKFWIIFKEIKIISPKIYFSSKEIQLI